METLSVWQIEQVSLRRVGGGKCWFYELSFHPFLRGGYNWPPVTVFVTMDGHMLDLKVVGEK